MEATFTLIAAIMGVSHVPLFGAASSAQPATVACTEGSVATYLIQKPGSVTLICPQGYTTWKPIITGDTVTDIGLSSQCQESAALGTVCPGAVGTTTTESSAVTFTIPQLPTNTTTMYMACYQGATGKDTNASTKGCGFALTVKGYSPAGPQACALPSSTIELAVAGEGGQTQFICGEGFALNPPDTKKAYGSDCTKEEDLKDLELTKGTDNYYTLRATKNPRKTELCYVCAPSSPATSNCTVLITVSAGSGFAISSMFGLALSCALTLLHFA